MKKAIHLLLYSLIFSTTFSQTISLTGTNYTQDFNTLINTAGSTTNTLTIPGWYLTETGGGTRDNEQYAVDAGASSTGDTYSYGAAASTSRSLGSLLSGTLQSIYGAGFTNNTGSTIISLSISYTGKQWRLGTAGRPDRLDFQYSLTATDLTTGTWIDADALDFTAPVTITVGAKNGDDPANQTALSSTITGLSIANGATFFIRWKDVDATGADDGVAIDDLTVAAGTGTVPVSLINFSAIKERFTTKISWTTTQEINSSRFFIERSIDGRTWNTIGSIAATGNSSTLINYSFIDANPAKSENMYRLRSESVNNRTEYSPIRRVNFKKSFAYSIYPNPATDVIQLTVDNNSDANARLQIINAQSQVITDQKINLLLQPVQINVGSLSKGIYYLKIINADGIINLQQFIKQ